MMPWASSLDAFVPFQHYFPVLPGILPAELRRQGATLFIVNRNFLGPDHIMHDQLSRVTEGK